MSTVKFPKGKTIDTRDLDSLAPAFKRGESRCGVYRLHFANGEAYCGQATNVIRRYSAHRRHHPDIVKVDFFPFSKARLNEAEQILIRETERDTSLRNIMLTGRPRGNEVVEITTSTGSTVALPWEPERAKSATQSYADTIDPKLATLIQHPAFLELRALVGWYIARTIPDPAATAGQLWTVTCLPSTNRTKTEQRLLTLSCGNLETLFVVASMSEDYANDPEAFVDVNLNTALLSDEEKFADPHGRWQIYRLGYRGEKVSSLQLDLVTLLEIIDGEVAFPYLDELLGEAYELNTRLMRRGSTMYTRFHNQKLADLLLAEAVVWDF